MSVILEKLGQAAGVVRAAVSAETEDRGSKSVAPTPEPSYEGIASLSPGVTPESGGSPSLSPQPLALKLFWRQVNIREYRMIITAVLRYICLMMAIASASSLAGI